MLQLLEVIPDRALGLRVVRLFAVCRVEVARGDLAALTDDVGQDALVRRELLDALPLDLRFRVRYRRLDVLIRDRVRARLPLAPRRAESRAPPARRPRPPPRSAPTARS